MSRQNQENLKNVLRATIEEFVNSPETNEEDFREMQWLMLQKMDVLANRILDGWKNASSISRSL